MHALKHSVATPVRFLVMWPKGSMKHVQPGWDLTCLVLQHWHERCVGVWHADRQQAQLCSHSLYSSVHHSDTIKSI